MRDDSFHLDSPGRYVMERTGAPNDSSGRSMMERAGVPNDLSAQCISRCVYV